MAVRRNTCRNPACGGNRYSWWGGSRVTGLTGTNRTTGFRASAGATVYAAGGSVEPFEPTGISAQFKTTWTGTLTLAVDWYDEDGTWLSQTSHGTGAVTSGTPVRRGFTAVPPAGAADAVLVLGSLDGQTDITALLIEPGGTGTESYFDGETTDGAWEGARYNSPSTVSVPVAAAPPAVLVYADVQPASVGKGKDVAAVQVVAEVLAAVTSSTPAGPLLVAAEVVTEVQPADVSYTREPAAAEVVVEVQAAAVAKEVVLDTTAEVLVEPLAAFGGGTAPQPVQVWVQVQPAQVGYSGTNRSQLLRGAPPERPRVGVRLMAQRIIDGRWVHRELPIEAPEVTWRLSGPQVITGTFRPGHTRLADLDLVPWGTWIHVEEGSEIRASGILQPTTLAADGTLTLLAAGPSAYLARVPYVSEYEGIQVDPIDVFRHLWSHVQSFPRGGLGVTVLGASPVRMGWPDQPRLTDEAGNETQPELHPYRINGFERPLCGRIADTLGTETPFDYVEECGWADESRQDVYHRIRCGYPRLGRRLGLRLVQGENITEHAPLEEPEQAYADAVYVMGRGEGPDAITGYAGTTVADRLRLPAVIEDKTLATAAAAKALAGEVLAARLAAIEELSEIAVNVAHPASLLGTFGPGDEVRPQVELPLIGRWAQWHRITSVKWHPDLRVAALGLTRRDQFRNR